MVRRFWLSEYQITPNTVREDERDDACLLSYIIIQYEFLNVRFQSVAIVLL